MGARARVAVCRSSKHFFSFPGNPKTSSSQGLETKICLGDPYLGILSRYDRVRQILTKMPTEAHLAFTYEAYKNTRWIMSTKSLDLLLIIIEYKISRSLVWIKDPACGVANYWYIFTVSIYISTAYDLAKSFNIVIWRLQNILIMKLEHENDHYEDLDCLQKVNIRGASRD